MKQARRIVVAVVGGTILFFGILLLVLPGPAFLVIPVGLGVLALEFRWARRWIEKGREFFSAKKKQAIIGQGP